MGFNDIDIKVSGGSDIISTLKTYTTRILKPNIVDGKNVLTQEMFSSKNTKYVIKYNYELLGATLTMPQNVILEFDGGSIKNGTLVGNDTLMLNTNETESVLDNVTLDGTWKESSYDLVEEVVADKAPGDGMGRIILRKDKTFAEQLTQENTIYVIRYDFELTEDVTIPANCVLQFDGGSLRNGTIVGQNTGIDAKETRIFYNVTLDWSQGAFVIDWAKDCWFGTIQEALDNFPNVILSKPEYTIVNTIKLNAYNILNGNGAVLKYIGSGYESSEFNEEVLNDIVYEGNYAIYSGLYSNIHNLTLKLQNDRTNGILIDPHYLMYTYIKRRFPNIYQTPNIAIPLINNIILNSSQNSGSAISIIQKDDYRYDAGLYGNLLDDILILGTWDYGIVVDNGKLFDLEQNPFWITLSLISNITIQCAKVGVFVGQTNNYEPTSSVFPPAGITFKNVKNQYKSDVTVRAAVVKKSRTIKFVDSLAIEWDTPALFVKRPFLINPNTALYTYIINCATLAHKSTKIYDLSEEVSIQDGCTLYVENVNFGRNCFVLTDFISVDADMSNANVTKKLITLPEGKYVVDSNLSAQLLTDLDSRGRYILKVDRTDYGRIFTLYQTFIDGNNPNSPYSFSQSMVLLNTSTAFYSTNWKKLQNKIVQKSVGLSINNSGDVFVSQGSKELNFIAEGVKYVYRGYLSTQLQQDTNYAGGTSSRPSLFNSLKNAGFVYFDTDLEKVIFFYNSKWVEADGAIAGVLRSGTFANKPASTDIYVGFKYFCTDRQTTEGATDGIEIIHKGNNVWVDALGRVVS